MASRLALGQIQAIVKARQIPESRRGSSVSTSQSIQEASQSLHGAPQTAHHLLSHLVSKNSQPLKIINSGVLTAPPSTQAARKSPQMY